MTMSALSDELAQGTDKEERISSPDRADRPVEGMAYADPAVLLQRESAAINPYPLETMLRLYLLQNLYDLSDEATAAEAIDSRAFFRFLRR